MKNMKCLNNFITGLFLVVFILTSLGMGFGEECQVFSSCYKDQKSVISAFELTINEDIHVFEVNEHTPETFCSESIGGTHSEAFLRSALLFLCILTVLSVFFKLIQSILVAYDRLYVHDRYHMIAFMQDMDGRKRIS